MNTRLPDQHCRPVSRNEKPLSGRSLYTLLAQVEGWLEKEGGGEIFRTFDFESREGCITFIESVRMLAALEDHHPEVEVEGARCTVSYSTHKVNGLTQNDFICAAKVNRLHTIHCAREKQPGMDQDGAGRGFFVASRPTMH